MGTEVNTKFIGKVLFELDTLPSTNTFALELLEREDIVEGSVVYTHHQSAGRGQMGTTWTTEPGQNLTMSIVLCPHFLHPQDQFFLNKAVSLSVRNVVQSLVDAPVRIKWPNDIMIGEMKVAGILIQNVLQGQRYQYAVCGIGLNVRQRHFDNLPQATSLMQHSAEDLAPMDIAKQIFSALEKEYLLLKNDKNRLDDAYLTALYKYEMVINYRTVKGTNMIGTIRGVNSLGQLQVENWGTKKILEYSLKEISFK